MSEGFIMSVSTAALFFRVCRRYSITAEKERIDILRKLVKRPRGRYIRDPKNFLAGKILGIINGGQNDR